MESFWNGQDPRRPVRSRHAWTPVAAALARDGRMVLTYDRRGVCADELERCSGGDDDGQDVVGAVRLAHRRGARRVVVGGASIGAMAATWAAGTGAVEPDGLIAVAGVSRASGCRFTRRVLRRAPGRKLFVSARDDELSGDGGLGAAASMRQWRRWARPPKRLVLLDSSLHGTQMLWEGEPTRPRLVRLIRRFVREVAAG